MTDQPKPTTPERKPTPTERVWEAFNMVLAKAPHRGSETVTSKRVSSGPLAGRTVSEVVCVREEGEEWDDFRARRQRHMKDIYEDDAKLDADDMRRDLEASVKSGPKGVVT